MTKYLWRVLNKIDFTYTIISLYICLSVYLVSNTDTAKIIKLVVDMLANLDYYQYTSSAYYNILKL